MPALPTAPASAGAPVAAPAPAGACFHCGLPNPPGRRYEALVGGINELVLDAVEDGRGDRLCELAPTVTELVLAVLDRAARPDV